MSTYLQEGFILKTIHLLSLATKKLDSEVGESGLDYTKTTRFDFISSKRTQRMCVFVPFSACCTSTVHIWCSTQLLTNYFMLLFLQKSVCRAAALMNNTSLCF